MKLTKLQRYQLAATLQDAWSYANVVTGLGWSTFEGDRGFLGIEGKCNAYRLLCEKCESLDIECTRIERIKTGEELAQRAAALQSTVSGIASKNGICASRGTLVEDAQ